MEVIRKYPEDMNKREEYKLMNSNETKKMSDAEGSVLNPTAWIVYEDVDNTGEIKKIVSLVTEDGEIFGTISESFISAFERIVDFFDGEVGEIKVVSGFSKAGRTYITCDIV